MAVIIYEALLVTAIIIATVFIALFMAHAFHVPENFSTRLIQVMVLLTLGIYFTWSWSSGRRTLAMKTWGVNLVTLEGFTVSPLRAALRWIGVVLPWLIAEGLLYFIEAHAISKISLMHTTWIITLMIFPWAWSLFHPRRLPFHDAFSGTQLMHSPSTGSTAH